jgi:Flp pilus assembly CpaE family ATPase
MPLPGASRTSDWKALVVCVQPELRRRLQAALRELSVEQPCMVTEYPPAGSLTALASRHSCNIGFVDAASNAERAQTLISELAPSMPVVMLHPRDNADLILRCLRRGASEFIADPVMDAVHGVLERLARKRSEAGGRKAGVLYCVAPGKPGCGASTLAAHLAIELRRMGAGPVLLVDGDAMAASIAFALKLKPEFHLDDVQRDWMRMDEDLWQRLVTPACGVDVLAAPDDPAAGDLLVPPFSNELCVFWRERYQAVVVDLPDLRAAADGGFSELADLLLLVCTNELGALHSAVRGLRYLDHRRAGARAKLRLILNRYLPSTGLRREEVETAVGLAPFAIVANDYETLQAALLEGQPAASGSRFAASVHALCSQLGHKPLAEKQVSSWMQSLFGHKAGKSATITG